MSRPFLLVLLALFASACSTSQWVRDGVTADQADRDQIDCQRWAGREASLRAEGFYGPPYGPFVGRFGPPPAVPHPYRMLDEAQLAELCMRAKGYERSSVP